MIGIDPRRRYATTPVTDHYSTWVLDGAIEELIMLRSPMYQGDAGADLHALISLVADAKVRLPELVADARDQEQSWTEIARQLGRSRLGVIVRYAHHVHKRRQPFGLD